MKFKSRRRRGSLPPGINSRQLTLSPPPKILDSTCIDLTTMFKAMLLTWGHYKVQNRAKRCIAGLILGRVFKIRGLMFYSSANDLVRFEFANDSKCANAPSLIKGNP